MNNAKKVLVVTAFLFTSILFISSISSESKFYDYKITPTNNNPILVWKDSLGEPILNFENLKNFLSKKNKKLFFAMNGGMYTKQSAPLGLYIENGKVLKRINTKDGYGNFHLKPNGVFYITTDNKAGVITTKKLVERGTKGIKYATQSGPMLLIEGKVHSAFTKGSKNLNIRNGIGVLPNGDIVFSMSKEKVNFYDFAMHFKKMGCQNALYLDGFVSKMYYPEKELKGSFKDKFGVMIAVVE